MNLIGVLISGVRGAENGSVELCKRGTSNRATWYSSFEGDSANASGADITLDANGGAEVYVDELVDIIVKASDGGTVRSFTAGDSSPPVEVRSSSFTGVSYATAASATGGPTTLQAVLDLWFTNNGAIDWKALFNGAGTTIKAALSMLNGKLFYNVKDDAFGATGNGTTDDRAAIQAAINAADAAGGGVIFFPDGTYRVSALTVPDNVHLVGMGGPGASSYGSILTIDHATADLLSFSEASGVPQVVYGLQLKAAQANTGKLITTTTTILAIIDCVIGDGANATGDLILCATAKIKSCSFKMAGNGRAITETGSAGVMTVVDCDFTPAAGAYSPTNGIVISHILRMERCRFAMANMTSGTAHCVYAGGVGSSVRHHLTHNHVAGQTGGTVYFINFSVASVTHLTKVYEDYNNALGNAALYAVNATPFTGDATAAASPGTMSWDFHLGSRERRLIKITHNATPFDLNTLEYGLIILERTDAVAQTLTANAAVPNGKLVIMAHNNTGGAGAVITTTTGFYPGDTLSLATTQHWDVRNYIGMDMLGNMRWLICSAQANI